ncbi:MAG: cytochrome c [Halioglobus sp.]
MKLLFTALFGFLSFGATPSLGAGDVEAGKQIYVSCGACHGVNAQGNAALSAPRLTHLEPVYVISQLQKFKAGVRGGAGTSVPAMQMAGMAAILSDDQAIQDVTAYIATLESPPGPPSLSGDAAVGADYFNQFCGACHGAAAQGNLALNSPRLAGADDWYLVAQLQDFRTGTRGTHAQDRTGRQMRAMAGLLSDDQTVLDVVAFIQGITAK